MILPPSSRRTGRGKATETTSENFRSEICKGDGWGFPPPYPPPKTGEEKRKLKTLQLARGGPVQLGDGRATGLRQLQLLAGALLVAAPQRVHAHEEGGGALAVAALGGVVGLGHHLE